MYFLYGNFNYHYPWKGKKITSQENCDKSHLKLYCETRRQSPFTGKWEKLNGMASLVAQMVKNLPAMRETQVWSLGQEDPLEKGMDTHSRILAWKIPWTEETGRLQSMGSQAIVQGCKESDTTEQLTLSLSWATGGKGFHCRTTWIRSVICFCVLAQTVQSLIH